MTLTIVGTLAMTALWLSMASSWLPHRRLAPMPVRGIVETSLTLIGLIVVLRYLRAPFVPLIVLEDVQIINSVAAVALLLVFWLLFWRPRWR